MSIHNKPEFMSSVSSKLDWVWQARYGNWLLSDDEFFKFDEKDYDEKAKGLKGRGVNTVNMCGYHFRWSWYPYWERLLEILTQVVQACHHHGLKVIEHHSAIIMYYPPEKKLERSWIDKVLSPRRITLTRYPDTIKNIMLGDFDIDGLPASSLNQVDISTGKRARMERYHSYAMCFNNPSYRERYFKYLKSIYATGVDGIMSDDVQFYPPGLRSCGCKFCREKYADTTGYELPPNGKESPEFFDDPRNPALLAWIDFRQRSHIEHHQEVNKHFQGLGLELARPNYSSSDLPPYGPILTGYTLEGAMQYFTTAGTEMYYYSHSPFDWLLDSTEAKHRSALGRRYGVPALTIYYPRTREEKYFEWALTKLWGQILWGDINEEDGQIGPSKGPRFENRFSQLYLRPEGISEIALLFSRRTRNTYYPLDDQAYVQEYQGWEETLFIENQPFDILLDEDLEEGRYFDRLKLLVLPNCACLSDLQIKQIKKFVSNGAKIVITHETGRYDEKGNKRSEHPLADLIGGKFLDIFQEQSIWKKEDDTITKDIDIYVDNRQPVCKWDLNENVRILMTDDNSCPVLSKNNFGKGKVIYIAGKTGMQYLLNILPCNISKQPVETDIVKYFQFDNRNPQMRKIMNAMVDYSLDNDRQIKVENAAEGLLVSCFRHGKSIVIHLCNASGATKKHGDIFSRQELPSFQEPATFSNNEEPLTIKIRGLSSSSKAIWRSPEFPSEKELPIEKDDQYTVVKIPAREWRVYSVIEVM